MRPESFTSVNIESPTLFTEDDNKHFEPVDKTYKIIMFFLGSGMMYPNPHNERKRLYIIGIMYFFLIPNYVIWANELYLCIINRELNVFEARMAIVIPLLFVNVKLALALIYRKTLKKIFDQMNSDYEEYNHMGKEFQAIAADMITLTQRAEKIWSVMVTCVIYIFPTVAFCLMMYAYLFSEPQRYMIHEFRVLGFTEEQKMESPIFEILIFYDMYVNVIFMQGFIGYGGSFIIAVFHACLRFKICSHHLKNSCEDPEDVEGIRKKLAYCVEYQCLTYKFVDNIQFKFQIWLVLIFVLTMMQIALTLYQCYSGDGFDYRYVVFGIGAVIHIFLPCYTSSEVTEAAQQVAINAYASGWEMVPDAGVRRSLGIIIARGQVPLYITAVDMLTFNMSLFVSILQTSYSVLTLLRQ